METLTYRFETIITVGRIHTAGTRYVALSRTQGGT